MREALLVWRAIEVEQPKFVPGRTGHESLPRECAQKS